VIRVSLKIKGTAKTDRKVKLGSGQRICLDENIYVFLYPINKETVNKEIEITT